MLRFTKKTLLLFAVLALVAAACGSSSDDTTTTAAGPAATTTTAAPTTTTTAAPGDTTTTTAPLPMTPVKTCLVTDLAGVDDRSFNASAWQGVQEAVASGAATTESFVLESDAAEDWQPNIDSMLSQGCEHLVTVGFALGEVTGINATANPGITWTIVDFDFFDFDAFEDVAFDNVRELVFQTDEAAFLAGYLAAGVSETGVMGTYGGAPFPTVSIFMDGFARGAQHYNDVKGTSVRVIGWDVDAQDGVFTGSFTDMGVARSTADSLFDENVDMIIPVGGAINLPAGDAITERGLDAALIGVDVDAFFAAPEQYQDLWLTSVLKNITKAVNDSVTAHAQGTWTSGLTCGTLANDGVGLSEFHSWDSRVSSELRGEVEALAEDIKSGAIDASFTFVADVC